MNISATAKRNFLTLLVAFFAVEALFSVLAILGIVVDPTTNGIEDSNRAMSYTEPWVDPKVEEE